MTYVELLDIFVKKNEGANLSTKIMALQGFFASLGENGIALTGENLNKLTHSLGIKNEKLYPRVQEYLKLHIAKSYRLVPKEEELETTNEEQEDLNNLDTKDFASADDTPDDTEYLASLGITNPERPWEK